MRQLVTAPSLRKAANGLVDVANTITFTEHDEDGVTFTPVGCQAVFGHVPTCPAEDKAPFYDCPPPVVANAYLLEVGLSWSLPDMGANPKAILTEAFDIATSPVLERLTSSGITDVAGGSPIVLPVGGRSAQAASAVAFRAQRSPLPLWRRRWTWAAHRATQQGRSG